MNETRRRVILTEPPKLTYKKATVPIKYSDSSYGFEEKWVWELYTPAGCNEQEVNDLLKSFKKGTKPMTLNEELTKLYKDANDKKAKSREFLEHTLPDRLRACAKDGFNCYTIPLAEIEVNGLTLYDIRSWCFANGLFCDSVTSLGGEYISIYWLVDQE